MSSTSSYQNSITNSYTGTYKKVSYGSFMLALSFGSYSGPYLIYLDGDFPHATQNLGLGGSFIYIRRSTDQ